MIQGRKANLMIEIPAVIWLPFVTWAITSIWDHRDKLFGFDDEEEK